MKSPVRIFPINSSAAITRAVKSYETILLNSIKPFLTINLSHISTVHTNIAALFMHGAINSETVTYDLATLGANSDVKFCKFAAFWRVCSGLVARVRLRAFV